MCQFRPVCKECGFGYSTIPEAEACEARHRSAGEQPFVGGKLAEGLIVRYDGRFFELQDSVAAQVLHGKVDEHPMEPGAIRFGQLRAASLRDVAVVEDLDQVGLGDDLMMAAVKLTCAARSGDPKLSFFFGAALHCLDLLALRMGFDLGECVREYFNQKKKAAA